MIVFGSKMKCYTRITTRLEVSNVIK